jgi:hypothetical protein
MQLNHRNILSRHYYYAAVYLCSVLIVPSLILPRHYHYTRVYMCSVYTVPSLFLPCHCQYTMVSILLSIYCDH